MNLEEFVRRSTWYNDASCRGKTRLFFSGDPVSEAIAVELCRRCPVIEQCRSMVALVEDGERPWGVWGGTTPAQRRRWQP